MKIRIISDLRTNFENLNIKFTQELCLMNHNVKHVEHAPIC